MSWRGILRRAGITSDGNNVDVMGIIRAANIMTTRGEIFYVHSGIGTDVVGEKNRPQSPFATIDYAVGQCTASRGDHIVVLPGHVETVVAAGGLDLDVAGITIWFLGEGSNRAYITFTSDADADIDVDAANVSLINPLFITGIDALTGPIDVNAADFKIVDGEWRDAAAKAATDCIVATAAAIRLQIDGWKFLPSTTGTQKQSNIQLNGVDDAILKNIDIRGDFATGNIENVTDEILNARLENIFLDNTNSTPKPGIVGDANMTGHAKNVRIRVASGTTFVSNVGKMSWDNDCVGFNADGGAGDPIGTAPSNSIEGKIDTIQAELSGTAGVTSFPAGAAADDAVSLAEVLRYAQENIVRGGTVLPATQSIYDLLAGANGIATFPAAAVPDDGVSIAEVLRDLWDAVRNGTGGAEPATNKSVMDYLGVSPAFFVPGLGYAVTKDCDLSGANDDLFTVTGKVLVTLIAGEVTTVLSGAEAFQLRIKTDNIALCAATTIDTDADGTHYMLSGDFGDAMNGGSTPGLRAADVNSVGARGQFVVGDAGGTCTIESNTTGNGGTISFTLFYLPLEASAAVAAA